MRRERDSIPVGARGYFAFQETSTMIQAPPTPANSNAASCREVVLLPTFGSIVCVIR